MKLSRSRVLQARAPETGELLAAIVQFFEEKRRRSEGLNENEATEVLGTLKHLREIGQSSQIHSEHVLLAITQLRCEGKATTSRQNLARALLSQFESYRNSQGTESMRPKDVLECITMLCVVGLPLEARSYLGVQMEAGKASPYEDVCFGQILDFLTPDDVGEAELMGTLQMMKEKDVEIKGRTKEKIVRYYANRNQPETALQWIDNGFDVDLEAAAISTLLNCCARLGRDKLGRQVIEKYLERHISSQAVWMAVFRFSTGTGRGIEEVDRMMSVMERRKPANVEWTVDNAVINDLVRFAIERKDPYLAERFVALGEKRGVKPNLETFILQMEYRIAVGDLDGALASYQRVKQLTEQDGPPQDVDAEVTAINHLIQAMCGAPRRFSFDAVMRTVDDLTEIKGYSFEVDTVSALCVLHLKRGELGEVEELLKSYSSPLSGQERRSVRDALVLFCLDKRNSLRRTWNAYSILHKFFVNEIPREVRERIMASFFDRRRADMAFHVFEHIRTHNLPEFRATRDTYVAALLGAARLADAETVEHVFNLLKIDLDVEPDTKLRNALIIAYTQVGAPRYSFNFWDDIANSREGPSYSSIAIALRACECAPGGDEKAQGIWDRLVELDVEITPELFTSWVCCLAGRGRLSDCREWLRKAGDYGVAVDAYL